MKDESHGWAGPTRAPPAAGWHPPPSLEDSPPGAPAPAQVSTQERQGLNGNSETHFKTTAPALPRRPAVGLSRQPPSYFQPPSVITTTTTATLPRKPSIGVVESMQSTNGYMGKNNDVDGQPRSNFTGWGFNNFRKTLAANTGVSDGSNLQNKYAFPTQGRDGATDQNDYRSLGTNHLFHKQELTRDAGTQQELNNKPIVSNGGSFSVPQPQPPPARHSHLNNARQQPVRIDSDNEDSNTQTTRPVKRTWNDANDLDGAQNGMVQQESSMRSNWGQEPPPVPSRLTKPTSAPARHEQANHTTNGANRGFGDMDEGWIARRALIPRVTTPPQGDSEDVPAKRLRTSDGPAQSKEDYNELLDLFASDDEREMDREIMMQPSRGRQGEATQHTGALADNMAWARGEPEAGQGERAGRQHDPVAEIRAQLAVRYYRERSTLPPPQTHVPPVPPTAVSQAPARPNSSVPANSTEVPLARRKRSSSPRPRLPARKKIRAPQKETVDKEVVDVDEDADLALAIKLQEEENQRLQAAAAQAPQSRASSDTDDMDRRLAEELQRQFDLEDAQQARQRAMQAQQAAREAWQQAQLARMVGRRRGHGGRGGGGRRHRNYGYDEDYMGMGEDMGAPMHHYAADPYRGYDPMYGAMHLQPDVDNMSYEQLMALEERMGSARQEGLPNSVVDALPTFTYRGSKDGEAGDEHNCSICLEDYAVGDQLKALPCFHKYHGKCVAQWLKNKSVCPVCRIKVADHDV